jgi:TRAP-type uncharacterized transport system substrate-binding protein
MAVFPGLLGTPGINQEIYSFYLQVRPVWHRVRRMKPAIVTLLLLLFETGVYANPYLPKPGERLLSMRVSTCAVSGGFVHLYTALDNGLFDKYGIKLENIFIRGSAQNLTALATDEVQFTYCASDAIIPGWQRESK